MKITNKTIGLAIPIALISLSSLLLIAETINHGCNFLDSDCEYGVVRLAWLIIVSSSLLAALGVFSINLLSGDIEFEYEIKLPKSKRKTLNKLYSKMGEAAMKGDEAEEKRIWNVIQKIEKK